MENVGILKNIDTCVVLSERPVASKSVSLPFTKLLTAVCHGIPGESRGYHECVAYNAEYDSQEEYFSSKALIGFVT